MKKKITITFYFIAMALIALTLLLAIKLFVDNAALSAKYISLQSDNVKLQKEYEKLSAENTELSEKLKRVYGN